MLKSEYEYRKHWYGRFSHWYHIKCTNDHYEGSCSIQRKIHVWKVVEREFLRLHKLVKVADYSLEVLSNDAVLNQVYTIDWRSPIQRDNQFHQRPKQGYNKVALKFVNTSTEIEIDGHT